MIGYFLSTIQLEAWPIWQLALIFIFFGVVVVIDIEHRAILHPVSAVGALLFAWIGILRHGVLPTLAGGLAGFFVLLLLYWFGDYFGAWLARRRGQPWEETALGFGDVNLAGVIGLLLGWPAILGGLMLSAIFGGVYSLGYIAYMLARRRYQLFAAIPYGPFLVLGALLLIILRATQGTAL